MTITELPLYPKLVSNAPETPEEAELAEEAAREAFEEFHNIFR